MSAPRLNSLYYPYPVSCGPKSKKKEASNILGTFSNANLKLIEPIKLLLIFMWATKATSVQSFPSFTTLIQGAETHRLCLWATARRPPRRQSPIFVMARAAQPRKEGASKMSAGWGGRGSVNCYAFNWFIQIWGRLALKPEHYFIVPISTAEGTRRHPILKDTWDEISMNRKWNLDPLLWIPLSSNMSREAPETI